MQLTINGAVYEAADNPDATLLWALRDELGLTGTKFGCGIGLCGACTVHVNGTAQRACITPLASVEGADIRTIEGLAQVDADGAPTLHPVQQAFVDQQVPQCGWCMSGQIMSAVALLESNPNPTEDEIVNALDGNFCRCGCYVRIRSAVQQAAQTMNATAQTTEVRA
jgi:isoquinoline 1-oxidoreductase alpha subunit